NDSLAAANNKQTKENNTKISAEARTKEICPPAGAPNAPLYLSSASTMQRKSITAHTKTANNRGLTPRNDCSLCQKAASAPRHQTK
ncbi:hypothetical protein, partial [Alloprevotella tannerae]|uniref:hypothetical protein n=1 Tax=Alloprevotella tannerae TaxID=76122 RepID=UPI003C6F3A05